MTPCSVKCIGSVLCVFHLPVVPVRLRKGTTRSSRKAREGLCLRLPNTNVVRGLDRTADPRLRLGSAYFLQELCASLQLEVDDDIAELDANVSRYQTADEDVRMPMHWGSVSVAVLYWYSRSTGKVAVNCWQRTWLLGLPF